jgi:hypothetical protein
MWTPIVGERLVDISFDAFLVIDPLHVTIMRHGISGFIDLKHDFYNDWL